MMKCKFLITLMALALLGMVFCEGNRILQRCINLRNGGEHDEA